MVLSVFLSTAISGVSESKKNDIYEYVERTVRNEYEGIHEDDIIDIESNFDEPPAPVNTRYPKLHHLEKAFNKMKNCDVFFLLAEKDGSIKPGCLIEMNAWLLAKGPQPIVRWKSDTI